MKAGRYLCIILLDEKIAMIFFEHAMTFSKAFFYHDDWGNLFGREEFDDGRILNVSGGCMFTRLAMILGFVISNLR